MGQREREQEGKRERGGRISRRLHFSGESDIGLNPMTLGS